MDPEHWFERLRAACPAAPGSVGEQEREALLDLARIAAHSSERWAAPISTYLVGVALAQEAPEERAAALQTLVRSLEPADP